MSQDPDGFVKIHFPAPTPVDGCVGENMWAKPLGHGRYRLENQPAFLEHVRYGDVFAAEILDGRLTYTVMLDPMHVSFIELRTNSEALVERARTIGLTTTYDEQISWLFLEVAWKENAKDLADVVIPALDQREAAFVNGSISEKHANEAPALLALLPAPSEAPDAVFLPIREPGHLHAHTSLSGHRQNRAQRRAARSARRG